MKLGTRIGIVLIGSTVAVLWFLIATAAPTTTIVNNLRITGVTSTILSTDANGNVTATTTAGGSTTLVFAGNSFIGISQVGTDATVTPLSVLSLSNNSATGGIDFSAATGTAITGVLHSLLISQFTGVLTNTVSTTQVTSTNINAGTVNANQIYDSGATSTECETVDPVTNLLQAGNCVITLNNLHGNVLATTAGAGLSVASTSGNLVFTWTNPGYLTNASITANSPLVWTATNTLVLATNASSGIGITATNGILSIINNGVTSFGGQTGAITTNASSGIGITNANNIFSIINNGVLSVNGSTGAVTGISTSTLYNVTGGNGITTTISGATATITALAGSYLGFSGSNLTVSSTLASSSYKFIIANATTTASTTNYAEWETDQQVNITNLLCKDTVGTTTLNIFVPTSYTTTTVSSTISSSFACGTASHTSSTNLTFAINTPIIVMVSSTAGTPVSTPVQISYTKL